MKIGIVGAGKVGTELAEKWIAAGHKVMISGRDADKARATSKELGCACGTARDAAEFGEVVLFSVPAPNLLEAVGGAGDLGGKILIDATNALGAAAKGESPAHALAKAAPKARVVKAFNTAFAAIHKETQGKAERPSQVYCGDDPDAKATVATLIADAGFEPFDCGGLAAAPDVEGFARVIIALAYGTAKIGPFFYYLKR